MNNSNTLTPDEVEWVRQLHPRAKIDDKKTNKLLLTPLQYITDTHARALAYWCDHIPFVNTKREEWQIKRDYDKVIVRNKCKTHSYHIHTSGNVKIYNELRLSNLGTDVFAMQFYIEHNYAYPINFGPGHWGTGRNAIELGVAVPNREPLDTLLKQVFNFDESLINEWYAERQFLNVNLNNLEVYNTEYMMLKNRLGIAV